MNGRLIIIVLFLFFYPKILSATGTGPPDLGSFGNIVFYGALMLAMYVVPFVVAVAVIYAIYRIIKSFFVT